MIDVPRLLACAARAGVVIEFCVGTGETIPERGVVARLHGTPDRALDREITRALTVGPERTFEQDPALAIRVFADIALRGLSPAVNDPTTAVQALDYVGLAVDEILALGMTSVQVRRRLERLLEGLAVLAPPNRRGAVESRLEQVRALSS